MNVRPDIETKYSACPHDCPSTCALEVEKLDDHTIGRVRGAADNSYTMGVVCAKVGRYAERIHHPDRLIHPMGVVECAGPVLFLLSDDASFITAADLPIDGGYQGMGPEGLGDTALFAGSK